MSAVLLLSTAAIVGCNNQTANNNTQNNNRVIKIGVLDDLTGDYTNLLRGTSRGIKLAVEDLKNEQGININITTEDLESCNPEKAVTAMNKLSNIDQVDFMIGGNCSNVTLAAAPIANQTKTVLISPGASAPSVSQAGDYVFRTYISDTEKAIRVAKLAYQQGYKKISIITENSNQAMIELTQTLEDEFLILGGQVLTKESATTQNKDFKTLLTKIKNNPPEVLFINSTNPNQIGLVLKQAEEVGLEAKFMSAAETAEDKAIIDIVGQLAEGIIYATVGTPPKTSKYTELIDKYKEIYQEEDIPLTLLEAYDAIMLGVKAVLVSDGTKGDIKNNLYEVSKTYQGVSGNVEFDENGDVHKDVMFKTIKDGEFVEYRE